MKKLTAEKCRGFISKLERNRINHGLSLDSEVYLQALEIALPVLEQQESPTDTYRQIESDGWIDWVGGKQPISNGRELAIKFRDGTVLSETHSDCWIWSHGGDDDDIIAYRVIENDGREG